MSFSLQKQIKETNEIKTLYSALMKTTEELTLANIQLENYAKKSEESAKIKERNRLAREIHDTVGHSLTGIVTGLEACKAIIDNNLDLAKNQIDKITDLGRKGLLDIRRSVKALRPDTLERFSLDEALQKMIQDIIDCTDIKIFTDLEGEKLKKVCPDEEEIIYRIVQESITNAVRHGKAKNIWIKIHTNLTDNKLVIDIRDDGFGSHNSKEGFGLKHIRERINLLNGEFDFGNRSKDGFYINVKIPLRIK
jgi:signal transduction histidine kinase